jgi:transposase-like protein
MERRKFTREFKLEAVKLVKPRIATPPARSLGASQ